MRCCLLPTKTISGAAWRSMGPAGIARRPDGTLSLPVMQRSGPPRTHGDLCLPPLSAERFPRLHESDMIYALRDMDVDFNSIHAPPLAHETASPPKGWRINLTKKETAFSRKGAKMGYLLLPGTIMRPPFPSAAGSAGWYST